MHNLMRLPLVDWLPIVALFAYAVPAFVVFLARSAASGVPRTARIDAVPRSPYLPRLLMEFGYWVFAQPVAICRRLGIGPDAITLGSLVATLGAAVALGGGWFALGGWLLLFAFALDAWDGILARQTGRASAAGEFLDATVDRYNDLIVFFGLLYYYRDDPLPLALGALALVGTTLTSYTRAKGEAVGIDPNVGYMQRHERAVWLGVATILAPLAALFLEPGARHPRYHLAIAALAVLAIATNLTAIERARFVLHRLKEKR